MGGDAFMKTLPAKDFAGGASATATVGLRAKPVLALPDPKDDEGPLREAGERNKSPVSRLLKTIVIIIGSTLAGAVHTYAEEPHAIELSPALHNLLKAEMQELTIAVQTIPVALATGDWKTIQDTSSNMQSSYMMEKNLTPAETEELAHALPARFKQLDAQLHQRQLGLAWRLRLVIQS
jgi:hypothetical protein